MRVSTSRPLSHTCPLLKTYLKVTPIKKLQLLLLVVVLVGDSNVGKTALVNRLVNDEPPREGQSPTIGVEFAKLCVWDRVLNVAVQLHIWDTAGQEKFRSLTSQ